MLEKANVSNVEAKAQVKTSRLPESTKLNNIKIKRFRFNLKTEINLFLHRLLLNKNQSGIPSAVRNDSGSNAIRTLSG